jgi:hypothetical protein
LQEITREAITGEEEEEEGGEPKKMFHANASPQASNRDTFLPTSGL